MDRLHSPCKCRAEVEVRLRAVQPQRTRIRHALCCWIGDRHERLSSAGSLQLASHLTLQAAKQQLQRHYFHHHTRLRFEAQRGACRLCPLLDNYRPSAHGVTSMLAMASVIRLTRTDPCYGFLRDPELHTA